MYTVRNTDTKTLYFNVNPSVFETKMLIITEDRGNKKTSFTEIVRVHFKAINLIYTNVWKCTMHTVF